MCLKERCVVHVDEPPACTFCERNIHVGPSEGE